MAQGRSYGGVGRQRCGNNSPIWLFLWVGRRANTEVAPEFGTGV